MDAKAATRRFIDLAWNEGRLDEARELLHPAFVNHNPIAGDETRDAFLARIEGTRRAFPDWRMNVEEMLATGIASSRAGARPPRTWAPSARCRPPAER